MELGLSNNDWVFEATYLFASVVILVGSMLSVS